MAVQLLFPTLVYQARLPGWRRLNAPLLRECRQLRADDAAGRRWSQRNYPGGYTSYNSAHRMHRRSPTFATLARELDRHVAKLARALQLDLTARPLGMTDCWVNVMGRGAVHGLHLHPLIVDSGCRCSPCTAPRPMTFTQQSVMPRGRAVRSSCSARASFATCRSSSRASVAKVGERRCMRWAEL